MNGILFEHLICSLYESKLSFSNCDIEFKGKYWFTDQ